MYNPSSCNRFAKSFCAIFTLPLMILSPALPVLVNRYPLAVASRTICTRSDRIPRAPSSGTFPLAREINVATSPSAMAPDPADSPDSADAPRLSGDADAPSSCDAGETLNFENVSLNLASPPCLTGVSRAGVIGGAGEDREGGTYGVVGAGSPSPPQASRLFDGVGCGCGCACGDARGGVASLSLLALSANALCFSSSSLMDLSIAAILSASSRV